MCECDESFCRLWLQKIMIQPENITYGKSSTVQNELFQMTDLRKPANKKENARRKKNPVDFQHMAPTLTYFILFSEQQPKKLG